MFEIRIPRIVLAVLLLAILPSLHAQTLSYGIDQERDSAAYANFRLHMDSIRAERPTVALVLSGGGAKGAAHIPVIRYLEKEGIPVDLVVGTSIGGLVGGLYACGYNSEELEVIIRDRNWNYLLRDSYPRQFDALWQKDYNRQYLFSKAFGKYKLLSQQRNSTINNRRILYDGLVHGRNIEDLFSCLTVGYGDETDFFKLPIPFVCVATDMVSAKPKVWHSGNLVTALRSTMSIPGLFTPVKENHMVLTDGAMRNNFPAVLAKELGADIVIGVDVSAAALNAGEMNNLLDIVYQTTDVLGRESYVAALKATDIYIQPSLSDFSLLSFDSESIDSIIERGRVAVETHSDEFGRLKEQLGNIYIRNSHNPFIHKAINLNGRTIRIDKIQFNGLSEKEEKYLNKLLRSKGNEIHIMELEDAIATIMGTQAFEKVTYRILGESEPYTIQFNCSPAPANEFGISARFDAVDYASLLLGVGFNAHQLTGSRLNLSARLGLNTLLKAEYLIRTGRATEIGTELSFQAARNGAFRIEAYDFRIDFNRGRADAHLSFSPWKMMVFRIGARLDYFYRVSMLYDYNIVNYNWDQMAKSNIYAGPYTELRSDSFDDHYFPTSGVQFKSSYNWYPKGLLHETEPVHAIQVGYRSAHTHNRLTFIPFIEARHVNAMVVPYINMLAVSEANKILDQQIVFIGINTPVSAFRTLGTTGINLRRRFGKQHYFTLSAQVLHESQEIIEFFGSETSNTFYGFAFEYAYKSILGPIRANIHWSDISKSLGFYIGLGLDF